MLAVKGNKLQLTINREAVRVRRIAVLCNKIFDNKFVGMRVRKGIANALLQSVRIIYPGNAFASCGIRRFYNDGPMEDSGIFDSIFYLLVALCRWNVKTILRQEFTELSLILKDANRSMAYMELAIYGFTSFTSRPNSPAKYILIGIDASLS